MQGEWSWITPEMALPRSGSLKGNVKKSNLARPSTSALAVGAGRAFLFSSPGKEQFPEQF